ncbi:MAG TPA: hypothetical protein VGW98_09490, partial [Solirubrobacteraceae bacterium]|nr:hypothetical protein [Solirubrobacteraceae bacterium]
MKKKLVIGFIWLLTITALAVTPAAALAETAHYTTNGRNITAEPVTTVAWGTISLKCVKGCGVRGVVCHVVAAGTAQNPGGGAPATDTVPGSGSTQVFSPYDCEPEGGEICPAGSSPKLAPENLPWSNKLEIVAGIVRQQTTGIHLFIGCFVGEKLEGGTALDSNESSSCCKGLTPASRYGPTALHPGFFEYGLGSGELEILGSNEANAFAAEGDLKVLGYDEQELINTKKDPPPSSVSHLEYVVQDGVTSVYDMDHEYKLLKTISLPSTKDEVRGVTVAPSTHLMFIPHGGDGPVNGSGNGSVLAYDLVTEKPVWDVKLSTGIDSGQVSPDATKLYIPTGENT